ncbi:MAG: hypothetical protein U5L08_00810 [Xanthomonadales bacterium]|nr:hypothetical protein [Xanthomonadales bacterium]
MSPYYLVLLIPLARFLVNLHAYLYMTRAVKKHVLYVGGMANSADDPAGQKSHKASRWLVDNLSEIKRRVEQAGVSNPRKTIMEPAGYGHVSQQSMSVLDNMLFQNQEILGKANHTMRLAAGHYKVEAIKSINPLFWVEVLIFLPKQIVSSAGLEVTSKAADISLKFVQVVYWSLIILAIILQPDWLMDALSQTKT